MAAARTVAAIAIDVAVAMVATAAAFIHLNSGYAVGQ